VVGEGQLGAGLAGLIANRYRLAPSMGHWLAGQIDAGRTVLLVDALDELRHDARGHLSRLLTGWTRDNPTSRLVVTSRIAGYVQAPLPASDVTHVELLPLTSDEISRVIDEWALPEPAAVRLRQRLREPKLAGMAAVPLLLSLLCALAAEPAQPLPTRRAELYDRLLRRFLTPEHRPLATAAAKPTDVDRLLDLLAPIAYRFADTPVGWVDRMSAADLLHVIRGAGQTYTELVAGGGDAAELLRRLTEDAGVLIPESSQLAGRNPRYRFLHRTFQEYLGARHLAALPVDHWRPIVEQHMWFDPDWEQVLLLLAAELPDPTPLLTLLLDQPDDPLNTALLLAARAAIEFATQHLPQWYIASTRPPEGCSAWPRPRRRYVRSPACSPSAWPRPRRRCARSPTCSPD
jgi:hypothetical protein